MALVPIMPLLDQVYVLSSCYVKGASRNIELTPVECQAGPLVAGLREIRTPIYAHHRLLIEFFRLKKTQPLPRLSGALCDDGEVHFIFPTSQEAVVPESGSHKILGPRKMPSSD